MISLKPAIEGCSIEIQLLTLRAEVGDLIRACQLIQVTGADVKVRACLLEIENIFLEQCLLRKESLVGQSDRSIASSLARISCIHR